MDPLAADTRAAREALTTHGGTACPACGTAALPRIDLGDFRLFACAGCGCWSSDALVRGARTSFEPDAYFANAGADRGRWVDLLRRANLDERVEEGDATAPVGERVVGEGVDGAAVRMLRRPPAPRNGDDAWPHALADAHREHDGRPVVEHLGVIAVAQPARRGIGGVDLDERGAFGGAVLGQR